MSKRRPKTPPPPKVVLPPELEALEKRLHDAREVVAELEEASWKMRYELLKKALGDELPDGIEFGGWACPTSPLGSCVYSNDKDPCHDDCIFCHDPEERK